VAPQPQSAVLDLVDQVAELVASGALNEGQGNALTVKLLHAIEHLDRGKVNTAASNLEAFVHQVTDLIAQGELLPADGDPLIAAARQILAYLAGPGG
jgi:hypothetical protein